MSDRFTRIPPGPVAALLLTVAAAPAPAPADPPATTIRMAAGDEDTRPDASRDALLAPLRRQVRRFDFEEAETALVDFPYHFKRNIAQDLGFTAFGRLALTDDAAASGRWSFRFDLDGASLSAAIPTGVLPILPLADYVVTVQVRTSGLARAGARLVAGLHDADGRLIVGSRRESRLLRTDGVWESVAVSVEGAFEDAADLVIELQVLQPGQQQNGVQEDRPTLPDVRGSVWFDDLIIWYQPRIELRTESRWNVVTQHRGPQFSILVRDLSRERLTARLRVFDLAGRTVFDKSFPAPRGRKPVVRPVPIKECGWYRADLSVHSDVAVAGHQQLDFVVVPESARPGPPPADSLAVLIPFTPDPDLLAGIPELVRILHVGSAVVTVWDERMPEVVATDRAEAMRRMIESLLTTDIDITFTLGSIPGELAAAASIDPDQVLELFSRDPSRWRQALDDLLINFGLRVSRWQLGLEDRTDAFWKPDLDRLVDDATGALSHLIRDPVIIIPFDASQEIPPLPPAAGINVFVPYQITPGAIPEYAPAWLEGGRSVSASFELLPDDPYAPRQQVVDLLLRALYGWRTGLPRMAIPAPWSVDDRLGAGLAPRPMFAAWRGLADALGGRVFVGHLPVGDGIECWLMEGPSAGAGALVAWSVERRGRDPSPVSVALGETPVRLVDPFGNARWIEPVNGRHTFPIGDMPVFVENIDLPLAQFRASVRFEPDFVPARHQIHDTELVLRNPWPEGISGTLKLIAPPGCHLSPRRHVFALGRGEEIRLPVSVVLDRSVEAGRKRIVVDVDVKARRVRRIRIAADLEVGLEDIEMRASWGIARNARTGDRELMVTQYITNTGRNIVNLDAFVLAPGVRKNRRLVQDLMPGATAIKTFRLPGAAALGGRKIRVGVAVRGGTAQLNRLLTVPTLIERVDGERADAGAPR